jgi:hypothetical protein
MNRIDSTLLLVTCLLLLSFACMGQDDSPENKGFELIKEKDNISIYERWVTFPKSKPAVTAREVKSVFYANTTVEKAFALLKNEATIKEWQGHVSKFKIYPQTDTTWFEYSYHDIPWPVSDQDHFLVYEIDENIPGEKIFITFESIVNKKYAPIDQDADRMTLAGSWTYEKSDDKVKITYRILSMPSSIPRLFTDPVIRNNMMTTIKSYINILEKQND